MLPLPKHVFFLAALHSSHDTRGNPLRVVPWRGVCCHRVCVTGQSQGKRWVLTDHPFPDPPPTSLLWREWSSLPLGYYFRLFVLNLSCLSMQCACEQWMIINVCLWSVYLSLAVKSAMHSIAWVKESKLWITGELNFNLYVKQRLRLKKKSNSFGRKMDMHFCSFIYSCSGMGTIFE